MSDIVSARSDAAKTPPFQGRKSTKKALQYSIVFATFTIQYLYFTQGAEKLLRQQYDSFLEYRTDNN